MTETFGRGADCQRLAVGFTPHHGKGRRWWKCSWRLRCAVAAQSSECKRSVGVRKLYIGNLPLQTTENALQDWFGRRDFKVEKVTLIRNHFSGQLQGLGFVELTSHEEAQRA